MRKLALVLALLFLAGCTPKGINQQSTLPGMKRVDFAKFKEDYKFTGEIPRNLEVEYMGDVQALNLYDPSFNAPNNLEKSQIFIQYFKATQFLTLNSVDILSSEPVTIRGHEAVKYEIEKKAEVSNFSGQPLWRSQRHKLIDVRYQGSNPSAFYVFSYNPTLDATIFEHFIDSLKFKNDNDKLVAPLDRAGERVNKKPFGIKVSPANSPVKPERFSGLHTGVDFEIFDNEKALPVAIKAVCDGFLRDKKTASGYGGVAIEECILDGQVVTVVYGHIKVSAVTKKPNDDLRAGESFAILGEVGPDTDRERKHLHLGIHKGKDIDIAGYVSSLNRLAEWIDAMAYL